MIFLCPQEHVHVVDVHDSCQCHEKAWPGFISAWSFLRLYALIMGPAVRENPGFEPPLPWPNPMYGRSWVPLKERSALPYAFLSQKFIICRAISMIATGFIGAPKPYRERLHCAWPTESKHWLRSALTTKKVLCWSRLISHNSVWVIMASIVLVPFWAKNSWGSKFVSIALPMSFFENIIFNNQLSLSISMLPLSFSMRTSILWSHLSKGRPMQSVKLTFFTCRTVRALLWEWAM